MDARLSRAWLSHAPGEPETLTLTERALHAPAPGEVRIAVKACGVNYFDYLIVQDLYQLKPPRPFAPGAEWTGVIEAIGAGVTRFKAGDRVMAAASFGGLAEHVVMPETACRALPASMSFIEGAGFQTAFGTSYYALVARARLQAGETLLVLGAAGGLGAAALNIGKALGARTIAAVSSRAKADFATRQGATDVVIVEDGDPRVALKAACGEDGAHVVYDPVGGPLARAALSALAFGGRYLVVGFTAGIPNIALNLVLLKHADLLGCRWGAFSRANREAAAALVDQLDALYAQGALSSIVTEVVPFARAPEAIAALGERRAIGKIVVDVAS